MTATTPYVLKPYRKENITTIQITKELKNSLSMLAVGKDETYNNIIQRLTEQFLQANPELRKKLESKTVMPKQKTKRQAPVTVVQYRRKTNTFTDKILSGNNEPSGPSITFEISYNEPISEDDTLFSFDLKIEKVIYGTEVYPIKEYFGVFQKDMVYNKDFMYYYFRALLTQVLVNFKKTNIFFRDFKDYFEIQRWREFIKISRLSPEILSSDVESVLSELNSKAEDEKLLEEVYGSISNKFKTMMKI